MNDIANEERQANATRALRLARARRLLIALGVFVILPTIIAAVFYGAIVTPQYKSVAVLAVESGETEERASGNKKNGASPHLRIVRDHILSRGMLDRLIRDHDLLSHYQDTNVDWKSRLTSSAGSEATYAYFTDHVLIDSDSDGTLRVQVFAFSAEQANRIASAIVTETNRHLIEHSAAVRQSLLKDVEEQVVAARDSAITAKADAMGDLASVEVDVANKRLAAALRALELAEAEAARRKRSVWVVSPPSKPDEPSRPKRLWNIATVFITTLALGGVVLLLGDFVREHAKV